MQILLIRHGQSEADLLHVHEGRADFPLTELGIEQVHKMAQRVANEFPPEMIWASTLQRASETASVLQRTVGCPIEYLPELREMDNGEQAGRPITEGPMPWELLHHEKVGTTGESWIEFRGRAEQVFSYIREHSRSYKRIAIVAHGGTISRLIETFLQLPVIHNLYFHTDDTGIHLLEYNDIGRKISFANSTAHLD